MKLNRTHLSSLALCLLSSLAFGPSATAAESDWPQWRGPNRDGKSLETGLLQEWPAGGPALVWKATGIGAGYSGVSVVDGRIFTMGDATDASFLYALNEADGKPVWAAKVGKSGGGSGYPGPRCTPTVDGDLVFALNQYGDLVCVEKATGKEVWHKSMVADFAGKMMSDWGYSESPLVDSDKLLCTPGGPRGTIVALNKKTGAEIWRTKDFKDSASYSSIIAVEIGGKRQFIQLTDASVVGVAVEDGKVLWRAPRPGRTAVITTPVFHDNCVFVTSGYGVGCNLFRVTPTDGQFKVEQVYANKVMANHHGGVIFDNGYLYGYDEGKGWVCMDFKTGKAAWEEKGKLGKGSILYADGHFYLRSESKGTVVLIKAAPEGYKETGRFEQPNRSNLNSWPHPVLAHGKLYLRDQGVLLCYKVRP
jgi:outer membrane protein assembly factor BamB